ncbi:TPA: fimbrial protein [Enterobacter cancerogenus]|uniref:fimbrial protein n=1 Tax=Enterobacter cancerogenus TaxID=69218 RepID=UPI0001827382|nr:fimbrial protein [Enterobacter cancerogenus]EFC54115.1 fimbrial protein [Enterobacter cancerogenus ATCC 35316]
MKPVIARILATVYMGLAFCTPAQAHDGTVYINGKIKQRTCTLSPDSQALLVRMGSVQNNLFTRVGDSSRYESFTINLESCQGSKQNLSISFEGTPDKRNPSLLALTPAAASATGIGIGIYNQDKTLIPMGNASATLTPAPASDTIAFVFFARYVSTAADVTTGTANASTTFIVNYA